MTQPLTPADLAALATKDQGESQATTPAATPGPAPGVNRHSDENSPSGSTRENSPSDENTEADTTDQVDHSAENEKMFPASYVKELRDENKANRLAAQDRDNLAAQLAAALVALDGRIIEGVEIPADLERQPTKEAITAWIDSALEANPRLSARAPRVDVGAGHRPGAGASLIDLIKGA